MRPLIVPFVLGFTALGTLAAGAMIAVAVVAQAAAAGSFRFALGPVLLVAVDDSARETSATFGIGILLVALAGGIVNAVAAGLLRRLAERRRAR